MYKPVKHITDTLKASGLPTVLYGTGNGAQKLAAALKENGITVEAVFSSDDFKAGKTFLGYKVEHLSEIEKRFKEFNTVVGFASDRDEVLKRIRSLKKRYGGRVYMPEVPVFGEGFLTHGYLKEREDDLKAVYSALCDEESAVTLDKIIEFKLSGDIDLLFEIEASRSETYKNILNLGNDEFYVDAGAFDGDTVNEFLDEVDDYRKIVAIEPAEKNFAKLKENLKDKDSEKITLINSALGDFDGTCSLSAKGGRSPYISDCGKVICSSVRLDSMNLNSPTFIKYDVEGAEEQALKGSEETIKRYRPRLCVSVYHKLGDFIDIPLLILKYNPHYKLYLRHYKYLPSWETNIYAAEK